MPSQPSVNRRLRVRAGRQPGFPFERVLFWLFLGVALLMLAIAVLTGVRAATQLDREIRAVGVVVELVTRVDGEGNALYYPVVTFKLPDGSRRSVETTQGSWPAAYRVDDSVTVFYDPTNPARARIDSPSGSLVRWIWPLVVGILAVAFLLAAALARGLPTSPRRGKAHDV